MSKIIYTDPILEEEFKHIPKVVDRRVELMMGVAYRLKEILLKKGWTQADLAKAMSKSEPEISKWLSGGHNFTLETIAKIEGILGEDILSIKRYRKYVTGYQQMSSAQKRLFSEKERPKYGKGEKI